MIATKTRIKIEDHEQSLMDDSNPQSDEVMTMVEEVKGANDRLIQIGIQKDQLEAILPPTSDGIKEMSKSSKIQQNNVEAMSINANVVWHDARSVDRRSQECGYIGAETSPDGTHVWSIPSVNEKMLDAQSERTTSIYSPPFFTSPSGYRVSVRLYLNGDGTARGTHLSLFLVILRGPYDSILKWPFSFRVAFCLVDQRALQEPNSGRAQDVIDCFRPNVQSVSFRQPTTGMNIASGIPKFMPLSEFEQPMDRNRYRLNDTIFIKTYIDFLDLPKEMIPFIFTIDAGLPTHEREKIIAKEHQRIKSRGNPS